jgi:hypothetical protein
MTKTFGILNFEHCDLFDIWVLVLGNFFNSCLALTLDILYGFFIYLWNTVPGGDHGGIC